MTTSSATHDSTHAHLTQRGSPAVHGTEDVTFLPTGGERTRATVHQSHTVFTL